MLHAHFASWKVGLNLVSIRQSFMECPKPVPMLGAGDTALEAFATKEGGKHNEL